MSAPVRLQPERSAFSRLAPVSRAWRRLARVKRQPFITASVKSACTAMAPVILARVRLALFIFAAGISEAPMSCCRTRRFPYLSFSAMVPSRKSASNRSVPIRLAPRKDAPRMSTRRIEAPERLARRRSAPKKVALSSLAPVKLASSSTAPVKSASDRVRPGQVQARKIAEGENRPRPAQPSGIEHFMARNRRTDVLLGQPGKAGVAGSLGHKSVFRGLSLCHPDVAQPAPNAALNRRAAVHSQGVRGRFCREKHAPRPGTPCTALGRAGQSGENCC